MRVTVKIATVEVTVDRPNFTESQWIEREPQTFNQTVVPTLKEATERAKELYQLQTKTEGA